MDNIIRRNVSLTENTWEFAGATGNRSSFIEKALEDLRNRHHECLMILAANNFDEESISEIVELLNGHFWHPGMSYAEQLGISVHDSGISAPKCIEREEIARAIADLARLHFRFGLPMTMSKTKV